MWSAYKCRITSPRSDLLPSRGDPQKVEWQESPPRCDKPTYLDNSMATENEEDIKQTIRRFLLDSINIPELDDHENLFELGIVNSLFAVQLMTFIEKTFGLEVEIDDLDIANFESLNAATAFVIKKKSLTS
jgi:methoxymalonate biosynthesis acyl carrier protein